MTDTAQSRYVRDCLRYLRHQKGLTLFWVWLERWIAMEGWQYDKQQQAFLLSANASARFLFGAPRPGLGASGKPVFLGLQHEEQEWISRLSPHRVVFDDASTPRWLWLIFQGQASPDQAWADLPPLALGIQVYPEQLVGWQGEHMDLRSIWWSPADPPTPRVSYAPFASLRVQHGGLLSAWAPSEVFVKSLRQRALERAESELEARGLDYNPGFQGMAPALDAGQRQLVEPFAPANVELVESNYRGLFGQFIDGVERGPRRRSGEG